MKPVKLAIPSTGRLNKEILERFAKLGILDEGRSLQIARFTDWVKKQSDEQKARETILGLWTANVDGITLAYDLRSGWRASFSAVETKYAGIDTVIYGSSYPAISGIREGVGDIAIIGYDELLASMLPFLREGKKPLRWSEFNSMLTSQRSTDVRVLGSLGLQDFAGLFLITSINDPDIGWFNDASTLDAAFCTRKLYVKGRNQGLAYYFLGEKIDAIATENLEYAINARRSGNERYDLGLDLVRSGKTLLGSGLTTIGGPQLYTLSVVVVDKARYETDRSVRTIADLLCQDSSGKEYEQGGSIFRWLEQLPVYQLSQIDRRDRKLPNMPLPNKTTKIK
ncbi:MAG TPA: hypothetical protein VI934_04470 [Candidatus Nanoarchaeia archaeon]|nr:hypothetical protein [Candidatus Nanoarchaeia archaeon]